VAQWTWAAPLNQGVRGQNPNQPGGSMTLNDWASIATITGAVIAIIVLWYTGRQVHQNTKISRGQFWLELEKMFSDHDDVHIKLRPGGEWSTNASGPSTAKEWATVEDYMGLFEHCEILLDKGLIDIETFKSLFSYRLHNIIANETILVGKLIQESNDWRHFISLLNKLDIPVPRQGSTKTLDRSAPSESLNIS
jgi:hypothetical protein